MPTGNAVIDRAIEAHGGEARFGQVDALDLTWTFRGTMFKARLREGQLRRLHARIETRDPVVTISGFPAEGAIARFTADRVTIERPGAAPQLVDAPRASFRSLRSLAWWTDAQMLYFAGYVLWNYAQLPFLLLQPGLVFHADGTSQQGAETWDKVRVDFPAAVPTHSPSQTFYVGPDGLLRRHDYQVAIMSRFARGARLIHAYEQVGGLTLPSRIQIKLGGPGESSMPMPSLGFVDLDDISLVEGQAERS